MSISSSFADHLQLLTEIAGLQHAFLMGGFAEDALLVHEITQQRTDIDLLVERDKLTPLLSEFAELGLARFEPLIIGPFGDALCIASSDRGLRVEVWPCTQLDEGYEIVLPRDGGRIGATFFRLLLPGDTFRYSRASLAGISVQTVSPLALLVLRAASARTRGNLEKRHRDLEMVEQIRQEFLPGLPSYEVVPKIVRVQAR